MGPGNVKFLELQLQIQIFKITLIFSHRSKFIDNTDRLVFVGVGKVSFFT